MGVAVPRAPVGTRSRNPLKSLVMGPSLLVNCYLEIKFEVNQTKIGHNILQNTPKTLQSGHISKPHFAQVSFTKKPTPPTFFNTFV